MIVLKSSADSSWPWADAPDECEAERRFRATYPSLHAHMKSWESHVEGETGNERGLRHREDQGRFWWELRPCAYYDAFAQPKIIYQVIQFYAGYSLDEDGRLLNDKAFLLPTADRNLIVVLNAPVMWWFNWRFLTHLKDEALSPMAYMIEQLPIAPLETLNVEQDVNSIVTQLGYMKSATAALRDWLHHEFGLNKITRGLADPYRLDVEGFVTAVRNALPKSRKWSAGEIARVKQEYADTLIPAREAAADILALECKLSDLVNAAYGLTPEEVALMWRTAPKRMPLDPTEELRRLALPS
jgi:hypothetical protein